MQFLRLAQILRSDPNSHRFWRSRRVRTPSSSRLPIQRILIFIRLKTHLLPTEAQYAYIRIQYANDTESVRVKFAMVIWIGESTKVMRKARVSIESGEVKRVLSHHSITVCSTFGGMERMLC